jgi:Zn-dependent M28 family amino/carboxypeptidase
VRLLLTPTVRENVPTDTVIGEIRGRERPDEIVLIGGHLDSWDLGTGAIDDASGIAISTAAAKLIHDLPVRPRRTIRVAMFGAEEIGRAGEAYATMHKAEEARTVIASEADFGADRVYGIALPAGAARTPFGRTLASVVAPLKVFISPRPATDGGADLEHLQGVPLASLGQDGTRYFDLHHSADDTLDKVDRAQLEQVVAAWAAFTYLAADSDIDFRAIPQEPAPGEARH